MPMVSGWTRTSTPAAPSQQREIQVDEPPASSSLLRSAAPSRVSGAACWVRTGIE